MKPFSATTLITLMFVEGDAVHLSTDTTVIKREACTLSTNAKTGVTYEAHAEKMTFDDANAYCKEHASGLATVLNEQDSKQIHDVIMKANVGKVWLGGYKESDAEDAPWQWTSGLPWDFTQWRKGYPIGSNSYGATNCLAFGPSDPPEALVYDRRCILERPFVCEKRKAVKSCLVYEVGDKEMTHSEGANFCRSSRKGSTLASFANVAEAELAYDAMAAAKLDRLWIGAVKKGDNWSWQSR